MSTPAEVVEESISQARTNASDAQELLLSFTTQLNTAIQTVPLVDVTWESLPEPTALTLPTYEAPAAFTGGEADIDPTFASIAESAITDRLSGGTGLDATVEEDIWDRARERELATMQASVDSVTRDSESLGFMLPSGVLTDAVLREQRNYYDKVSTLSRDIAVKQAELEQSNMQKIIDQALVFDANALKVDEQALAYNEQAIRYELAIEEATHKRKQIALETLRVDMAGFEAMVTQDVKHWEIGIKQYEAIQNYTFTADKLNTEILRANANINLEAAKVGTQAFAQLLASAWGAVNVSAGVSATSSNSVGYTYSNNTATKPTSVTAI